MPIFRSDTIKSIACSALNEARGSGGFPLYAYVVMPDHIHVITDSVLRPSKTLQFINGITARRVINDLKEHNYQQSLKNCRELELLKTRVWISTTHENVIRLLCHKEMNHEHRD